MWKEKLNELIPHIPIGAWMVALGPAFSGVAADPFIQAMLYFSFFDTVSGHVKAWLTGQVISRRFSKGAIKLGLYLAMGVALQKLGAITSAADVVAKLVSTAIAVQELLSIIENFYVIALAMKLDMKALPIVIKLLGLHNAKLIAEAESATADSIASSRAAKKALREGGTTDQTTEATPAA